MLLSKEAWGPTFWAFIHTIAETYIRTDIRYESYLSFFLSLHHMLPCPQCAKHYHDYLTKPGVYMALKSSLAADDGKQLREWVIELHNHVNAETDKPILSQKDALDAHAALIDPDNKSGGVPFAVIAFFLVLVFLFFFYK